LGRWRYDRIDRRQAARDQYRTSENVGPAVVWSSLKASNKAEILQATDRVLSEKGLGPRPALIAAMRNSLSPAIAVVASATSCGFVATSVSAAMPTDAASGVRHLAHRPIPSLCLPSEKKYFSCPVRSGETASVCGSLDNQGRALVQYRFGVVGKAPQVVFPRQPSPAAELFKLSESGSAHSTLLNLRFESDGTTYVLYQYSASMLDQIDAGVATRSGASPWTYSPCQADLGQSKLEAMTELDVSIQAALFDEQVLPP
jgi:hypothetical protein